jgi:nucleoside 2-deoxyribosyltransferase
MRRLKTLYLAGPDALYPDSAELIARKRLVCEAQGLTPRMAADEVTLSHRAGELRAREAYAGALANLRASDAVIANLTPWRGPGCDPATAFEVGFASALGKPVLAYMNLDNEEDAEYRARVEAWIGAAVDEQGVWRDADGCEVEDLDLPEAAMLWAEARRLFIIITPDPLGDVTGVELCIEALKAYAEE